MKIEESWIKISRKILEWGWYTDIKTFKVFIHMLLRANWKDGEFLGTKINRGSFATSYSRFAEECGLTIQELRTAIAHLKSTNEVTSNQHGKFTVFTVINYNRYQTEQQINNRQSTDEQQTSNRQSTDEQQTSNRQSTDEQQTSNNNRRIEEYKKGRKEERKKGRKEERKNTEYQLIADMYNDTCVSFPKCTTLSDSRKKAISARIKSGYTLEDFKKLFKIAEESRFLKGGNDRNWKANFDWLIKDSNMAKVLDGNYLDRGLPKKGNAQTDWDAVREYYKAKEGGYDNTGDN